MTKWHSQREQDGAPPGETGHLFFLCVFFFPPLGFRPGDNDDDEAAGSAMESRTSTHTHTHTYLPPDGKEGFPHVVRSGLGTRMLQLAWPGNVKYLVETDVFVEMSALCRAQTHRPLAAKGRALTLRSRDK